MNWIDEVSVKLKKNNQILFSKNSEYMQDLIMLFETQSHRVMALWAFDFASESIAKLEEKYPEEKRPRETLEAVKDWASGKIKMRFAQRKIGSVKSYAQNYVFRQDTPVFDRAAVNTVSSWPETVSVPPCSSRTFFAMGSPRPFPWVEWEVSAW